MFAVEDHVISDHDRMSIDDFNTTGGKRCESKAHLLGMGNHAEVRPATVCARDRLMEERAQLVVESSCCNPVQEELNLILRQCA